MTSYEPQTVERTDLPNNVHTEPQRTRVPVAGGVLVYHNDPEEIGRRLIGFEDVTDRSKLRQALAARGHAVGAIHHLPVLDRSTP